MRNSGIPISKLRGRLQEQVVAALHPLRGAKCATSAHVSAAGNEVAKGNSANLGPALYPFVLWLDYRVPSLNSLLGKNRFVIKRHKDAAKAALAACLSAFASWPQHPTGRMHVIVTCYVIQPRDVDNPCVKLLVDELRHAGLLRADDPGAMALTINPEVRVNKRKLEGTRLTIAEALP